MQLYWLLNFSPYIIDIFYYFSTSLPLIVILIIKVTYTEQNSFWRLLLELSYADLHDYFKCLILCPIILSNCFWPNINNKHVCGDQCVSCHHFLIILGYNIVITCYYALSIESFPYTSKTSIFYFLSKEIHIPLVVLVPICCFSTSKFVPNRKFSKVLLPLFCTPIMATEWYSRPTVLIVLVTASIDERLNYCENYLNYLCSSISWWWTVRLPYMLTN